MLAPIRYVVNTTVNILIGTAVLSLFRYNVNPFRKWRLTPFT
jgi:hypothetical protein